MTSPQKWYITTAYQELGTWIWSPWHRGAETVRIQIFGSWKATPLTGLLLVENQCNSLDLTHCIW